MFPGISPAGRSFAPCCNLGPRFAARPELSKARSPTAMRLWLTLAGAACVSACTTYAAGRLATADGTVRPPASPAHMVSRHHAPSFTCRHTRPPSGVGYPQ